MRDIRKTWSADEHVLIILMIKFSENVLYSTSISKCCTYVISFNLHKS